MRHLLILCLLPLVTFASTVNIIGWGGEIPSGLISRFERQSGIKVNFTTVGSNEALYASLNTGAGFDIVLPSSYYIARLRKEGALLRLDKTRLPHYHNINPVFLHLPYDPHALYAVPLHFGTTGLFYTKGEPALNSVKDLWHKRYKGQLLLLDDAREAFALALLKLGFDINDENPAHLKQAFKALMALGPNIKLFASGNMRALLADNEAKTGQVWSGDFIGAAKYNKQLAFVYPKEGFVLWLECFAVLKNAPHKAQAYRFLDFMLNAKNAAFASIKSGYSTTNRKAMALLPPNLRDSPIAYPDKARLERATLQKDLKPRTLKQLNFYWQTLKISL